MKLVAVACFKSVKTDFNSDALSDYEALSRSISHRAVGVLYRPEYESLGHYVPTAVPKRYDHFLFFDTTEALHPMDVDVESSKVPETFPFGI
ncbi:erythromycin esterase family protein [Pricia sp. S334]|uniref:Erythromycin esterase family protein n=1 Tax=Pricia mediterranea TaxID=3076079 RepID=A0ABU3L1K8_9FLAO|nr:erythromycin esterase family protein [Pricia sp. S334]MDT7827602.1 erythromycin esterase family protein [Pricia sp. S334]